MSPKLDYTYNVLCVDDNKNNLFTLNALLSSLGNIKSFEALDAKKALDTLLSKHIDLILCDVQMPDINGFELAKMIKSNSRTQHIPIIFVTAVFKSEEFIKQGFELGAIDYITKPIDDNHLLNKILLYLDVFEKTNKALQRERIFHDIAQSLEDGVYTVDKYGKMTFMNKKALRLLGYKNSQLKNMNVHDFIHYKDWTGNPHLEKDCKVHGVLTTEDIYENKDDVLIKQDGSILEVSLRSTPLYDHGVISGCVVVFKVKN